MERLLSDKALKIAATALLALYACLAVRWGLQAAESPRGFGNDFLLFWSTARMAAEGRVVDAWAATAMLAEQRRTLDWMQPGLIWVYPPPAMLLVRPLAALPFLAGFAVWSVAGAAAYATAMRVMVPGRWTIVAALAFPAAFTALYCGQTGLFVGAALGAGLWLLDRRPWLAGALIGLMVCKPQFAVLTPLLLIGTGRWRSVVAAAATAGALCLASVAAFGMEPWLAFLRELPSVSAAVTAPHFPLHRMPSVFATAFSLGATREAALAIHAAVAGAVALATLALWRRPGPQALKAGAAAAAALIVTPYVWDYDLPLLGIAAAALAWLARERALSLGERLLFLLIAASPLALAGISEATGVQLTSLALLACWAGVARVGWIGTSATRVGIVAPKGLAFTAS